MVEIKANINERMWASIKSGIVFPVREDGLELAPEVLKEKLDNYDNGKKMFLHCVELMALSILPKLSQKSEEIVLTLAVEEGVR